MLKKVGFSAAQLAAPLEVIEVGIEAAPSQRDHYLHITETGQLTIQIVSAVREFLWQGLVIGRSAPNRRGDVEVFQLQSVLAIGSDGLIGKASFVQYRKHEFARCVPSKRTAGAIRSVCPGSEPQNQNSGCGIAESRHRLAPILTIPISPAFLASNLFAIFHQPRTAGTDYEFRVKPD